MRSPGVLFDRQTERGHKLDGGWQRSPLGLLVPPRPRRNYDRPVAVDLFAGAGGFSMGFHQAGFHVAAASEMWTTAAITYMVNLARPGVRIHTDTPERHDELERALTSMFRLDERARRKNPGLIGGQEEWSKRGPLSVAGSGWISGQPASHRGCEHFFLYDIRNLTGQAILDALGLDIGDVAAIVGGPPCQGFSAAGRRDVMDPRNSLVFEFARLVCEIQPRTFVMENVPAIESMVTPEGVPVLDAFALAVSEGGYGEYGALKRALSTTGGRAGVKGAKRAKRDKRKGDGEAPTEQASQRTRRAVAAARDDQPDLFQILETADQAEVTDA